MGVFASAPGSRSQGADNRYGEREPETVDCVRMVHKARNIAERLPREAQATVRKALRQA